MGICMYVLYITPYTKYQAIFVIHTNNLHHLLPLPLSQLPTFQVDRIRQDTQASATHATPIKNTQLQFPCIVSPEIGLTVRSAPLVRGRSVGDTAGF